MNREQLEKANVLAKRIKFVEEEPASLPAPITKIHKVTFEVHLKDTNGLYKISWHPDRFAHEDKPTYSPDQQAFIPEFGPLVRAALDSIFAALKRKRDELEKELESI